MIKEVKFENDDLLNRKIYGKNLLTIIKNCHTFPKSNDNNSYVIGLDAGWGYGKTYFINMLMDYINEECKQEISTIYYDAWENDFWNNAFEPFFATLIKSETLSRYVEKKDIIELGKSAAQIVTLGIKGFVLKKIENTFDTDTFNEILNKYGNMRKNAYNAEYQVNETFPEYFVFKDAINSLRDYLGEYVKNCGGKLVVFVDELDRCKPTFAIQTLEIVKHLFNVEGLVFVFALDITQLSQCVKSVYGEEIDAIGYLERFFNYISTLPQVDYNEILSSYIKEFKIKYTTRNFFASVYRIAADFSLSLRDLRTVLTSFYVLQKTTLSKYVNCDNALILYFYFLTMKYKKPFLLNKAIYAHDTDELFTFISKNLIPFEYEGAERLYITKLCSQDLIINTKFEIVKAGIIKERDVGFEYINGAIGIKLFDEAKFCYLQDDESLSFLLYKPDLNGLEMKRNCTVLEYIYTNMGLCEFVYE